jgi:hypothetical protein
LFRAALHHVKVLAIDQLVNERQEQPTVPKAVTLEVTPEQAQIFCCASNIGKLLPPNLRRGICVCCSRRSLRTSPRLPRYHTHRATTARYSYER